jgi:hypothetical protein
MWQERGTNPIAGLINSWKASKKMEKIVLIKFTIVTFMQMS